jgi:hypothetical protein
VGSAGERRRKVKKSREEALRRLEGEDEGIEKK